MFPKQAVILCGGLGTRLGHLTADTPKPLLHIGGVPFLEVLIREVSRSGIRRFLLLAGHLGSQVETFASALQAKLGDGFSLETLIENEPAGTGGAVFGALERLDDLFVLLNGDSFFDFPLHRLGPLIQPGILGAAALRKVEDVSRYGEVFTEGRLVSKFIEKSGVPRAGLINGGVYLLRKEAIAEIGAKSSLERDLLPKLAETGRLSGEALDGFFIDIGLPETYEEAGRVLNAHRHRPAVFFDRDGVLNRDTGHVGTIERWEWTDGATNAIRRLNEAGFYVFIVTNQAGIAKNKYSIEEYWALRDSVRAYVYQNHAQIDDERFCPYHPDGTVEKWRGASNWRKPEPGMINDLLSVWPVDRDKSLLIGDKMSDLEAAQAAAIRGYMFEGGNLDEFVEDLLAHEG